jgi:hypothetical protein
MVGIVLQDVTRRWGAFVGVKDLSLSIADREFLVLLGPSGCGKTTTMRMIAGLEDPSSGTISIGGRVVNDLEPKDRDVAMVFQSYGLYPSMNVYDNICFPLKVRKVPRAQHDERVRRAAAMVELTTCSTVSRANCRAGSDSAWRSPARWCGSRGVSDGRAALQPRREAPGLDAGADQAPAARARRDHRLRHPRPDRGHDAGRPRGGDEQGRDPAGRVADGESTRRPPTPSSRASSARPP